MLFTPKPAVTPVPMALPVLVDKASFQQFVRAQETAAAVWEREFFWSINQSVTPAAWFLFQGDTGTTRYTIGVTREGKQDTFSVRGNITINNTGAAASQGLEILRLFQDYAWKRIVNSEY